MFPIAVPPLRDRISDIPALVQHFVERKAKELKLGDAPRLAPGAIDDLMAYDWPGNVRELENAMERAVALARGSRVELEDLPEEIRQTIRRPTPGPGKLLTLADVEKEYILEVLARNDGNRARTAEQLRIGTATLFRKLKRYGLIKGRSSSK